MQNAKLKRARNQQQSRHAMQRTYMPTTIGNAQPTTTITMCGGPYKVYTGTCNSLKQVWKFKGANCNVVRNRKSQQRYNKGM